MAGHGTILIFKRTVVIVNIRREIINIIISFRKYIINPTSNIRNVGFFIASSVLILLLGIADKLFNQHHSSVK